MARLIQNKMVGANEASGVDVTGVGANLSIILRIFLKPNKIWSKDYSHIKIHKKHVNAYILLCFCLKESKHKHISVKIKNYSILF